MSQYEHPVAKVQLTVDDVIFTVHDRALKVLLIQRANQPFRGQLALPGGFIQETETAGTAAARVLHGKTGVHDVYMEQLYTFDSSGRDPRGNIMTVAYYALVPFEKLELGGEEAQNPTLHDVASLDELAFDHKAIIDYAIARLRAKLEYTNVVFSLLPDEFTLGQLQTTYEVILGRTLDKRNFRKKYLSLDLIKPTEHYSEGGRHRPAQLYRFASRRPIELQRWF